MTKNKINMKSIAKVLAVSLTLSYSMVPAYADNNLNVTNEAESYVNANSTNDILVDSDLKEFDSLDKVQKYLDFNYKVPDYTSNNSIVSLIRIQKFNDGKKVLQLSYHNDESYYSIYEFKGDPMESFKDITCQDRDCIVNFQSSKESKTLGKINGMYYIANIDANYNDPEGKITKEYSKFFVFEKDGVYYAIDSMDFNDENNLNIEVNKIFDSLKSANDVKNINYKIDRTTDDSYSLDVYDRDDFNEAVKRIGFTPKLVSKITDDIKIDYCSVYCSNTYGKPINTFQCDYTYKNNTIVFIQEKDNDNYGYNKISQNGYATNYDYATHSEKKIDAEILNWNNVNVYKYFDDCDNKVIYQWKIGDIYYFFETYFNGEKENVDDIVMTLFKTE